MITREEINQFVKENNLSATLDKLWAIDCAAYPDLTRDDYVGADCRLAIVEHVIHQMFLQPLPASATGSITKIFQQQFHASQEDIAIATVQTENDFREYDEPTEITPADIATTMIWIWLIDTNKRYGDSDTELKYFLYATAAPFKDSAELRQKGMQNLIEITKEDPSFIQRILSAITKKSPAQ